MQKLRQFNSRLDVLESGKVADNGYVPLSVEALEDIVNCDISRRIHARDDLDLDKLTVETMEKLGTAYAASSTEQTLEEVIEIYEERVEIITDLLADA